MRALNGKAKIIHLFTAKGVSIITLGSCNPPLLFQQDLYLKVKTSLHIMNKRDKIHRPLWCIQGILMKTIPLARALYTTSEGGKNKRKRHA